MAPWLWKVNHKGLGKRLHGPINTGSSCIVRMSVYNNYNNEQRYGIDIANFDEGVGLYAGVSLP